MSFMEKARDKAREARYTAEEQFLRRWKTFDGWIDRRFTDETVRGDAGMAQEFKSDATAIEEAPVPVSVHAALYAVVTLLVLGVLWSIIGSVDRIVVAPGKIATRTPLVVMQPFTTSRIADIAVLPGDHVKKGQMLVAFDPAFADADVASLEHKVRALSARVERITAQLDGTAFAATAADNRERQTEAQIFTQEAANYDAEMAQRDSRVAAVNSELHANTVAVDGLKQQLDMSNKVVSIYQHLLEEKAGAPLDVMKAQSSTVDVNMKLASTTGEVRKLAQQRLEIQSERQAFVDKWRSDHNHELVQARQDLAEASETLTKAHRMREFTRITAPVSGTVLEIADRSVGSVLKEAETLVTLVPDGAALYVEANVPSRDVSYLKPGADVRVKLESYPFQKYGTLNGKLDVISADSIPLKEGEQSQLVYRARVRLTDPPAELAKRGLHLRPGLVASAEIKTGKRSIASYVLNPILRTADEGMREP
ncbi:HlyD family type I secretion periplasmic adaptor subunit [Rhizomicrobium electricum]|uniref:Membrane fusion protein (MFP) family protein n=1 Tax=Rhizomicrobium electricum TaxID=480070 RepID=A0ABN1EB68_9PROT|nr:HlyD family type I secretion periplasmic adaptor subunit [Rhizomicrobium electricum]NIJ48127.1 HlyD family secretion protein [Rhizomicrobium electricum]